MSDSLATASNVEQSPAAAASYSDDFHSTFSDTGGGEKRSHGASPSPPQISPSESRASSVAAAAAVAYRFRGRATRRSICVYAPTLCFYEGDEFGDGGFDERRGPDAKGERPRPRTRSRHSLTTASYSSNFDDAETTTNDADGGVKSASSSTTSSSNAGYMRVMSIEELTATEAALGVQDRYLRAACERLRGEGGQTSPPPLPPPPPAAPLVPAGAEATAKALLMRLPSRRRRRGRPSQASSIPPPTPGGAVPRLTVESLRVENLRLGARLLIGHESHEPRACPSCREARDRLAKADWLRLLANRVRRETLERRLEQHQPASVMSRQMLNVAENARLVSDWLRSGRVPERRGLS